MLCRVCSTYDADIPNLNNGILIINLVENALNRFSKRIFTKLIEIPEISFMIQHFCKNNPDRHDVTKEYEECYRILDSRSKAVVMAHNKEELKKEESDSPVLIKIEYSSNQRRGNKNSIPKNLWDSAPQGYRAGTKSIEYYIRRPFFTCLGPPKVG